MDRDHHINKKRIWKYDSKQAESLAEAKLNPIKILLYCWDRWRIIYFKLLPRGKTITAKKCCKQLS